MLTDHRNDSLCVKHMLVPMSQSAVECW